MRSRKLFALSMGTMMALSTGLYAKTTETFELSYEESSYNGEKINKQYADALGIKLHKYGSKVYATATDIDKQIKLSIGYFNEDQFEDGFNTCGCDIMSIPMKKRGDKITIKIGSGDGYQNGELTQFRFVNVGIGQEYYENEMEDGYSFKDATTLGDIVTGHGIDEGRYSRDNNFKLVFKSVGTGKFQIPIKNFDTDDFLNVRNKPIRALNFLTGVKSKVIGKVPKGVDGIKDQNFFIIEAEPKQAANGVNWYKVKYIPKQGDEIIGFVSGNMIKVQEL